MSEILELKSLSDPGGELFAGLTDAQLRRRDGGLLIAEGLHVIESALDAGVRPAAFLVERKHIRGKAAAILERCPGVPVYTGDSGLLAALTGFPLTRGVLCALKRPEPRPAETADRDAERVAVLDGINDAANVGALFRSAAALGIDAVLVTPSTCDPFHRRAVRVSMGTVFRIPWAGIPDAGRVRALGFRTAAFALRGETIALGDPVLRKERRLALTSVPRTGDRGRGLCGPDPHAGGRGFAECGSGGSRGLLGTGPGPDRGNARDAGSGTGRGGKRMKTSGTDRRGPFARTAGRFGVHGSEDKEEGPAC